MFIHCKISVLDLDSCGVAVIGGVSWVRPSSFWFASSTPSISRTWLFSLPQSVINLQAFPPVLCHLRVFSAVRIGAVYGEDPTGCLQSAAEDPKVCKSPQVSTIENVLMQAETLLFTSRV